MRFEIRWQIDDVDSTERAFLRTDTTPNTQTLGNEGDLGFGCDLDAETSASHDWARFLAFLSAFLWPHVNISAWFVKERVMHLWLALFFNVSLVYRRFNEVRGGVVVG